MSASATPFRLTAVAALAAVAALGSVAVLATCGVPSGGRGRAEVPAGPARAPRVPVAGPPGAPSPQPPAMRPLDASAHLYTSPQSQLGEPETRVIRDQAGWEAAWRELHAELGGGAPPAVDFSRDMVVLVSAGQRSSGGHAVHVDGVSDAPGGGLVLHATRTAPGEGCMSTAVMSAPVDVVRVPRAAGPVRVATRDVAEPC